jgi:hypothetical protein
MPRKERKTSLSSSLGPKSGLLVPGTIDTTLLRPIVPNPDGTTSTIDSISFQDEQGREVLVPQIVGGRRLNEQEAIDHYYQTGEHLGMFTDPQSATQYGWDLHNKEVKKGKNMPNKEFYGKKFIDKVKSRSVASKKRDMSNKEFYGKGLIDTARRQSMANKKKKKSTSILDFLMGKKTLEKAAQMAKPKTQTYKPKNPGYLKKAVEEQMRRKKAREGTK